MTSTVSTSIGRLHVRTRSGEPEPTTRTAQVDLSHSCLIPTQHLVGYAPQRRKAASRRYTASVPSVSAVADTRSSLPCMAVTVGPSTT